MKNDTPYYNEVGDYYDIDALNFDERYWENPILQQIRQSFREEVKRYPAATMLEIGFGTGFDLVHFGKTHPDRNIYGIDISQGMVDIATKRIHTGGCKNIEVFKGTVEDIPLLFQDRKFDLIYVFFGALNTVEDLKRAADYLRNALTDNGTMVLSFVNKWYLAGVLFELVRFRFSRAFARFKKVWGGYSPDKHLPSKCYTPRQIKWAFEGFKVIKQRGYSIVQPAWYYIGINKKLGKIGRILWNIDQLLDKTFLWRFGEYTLFVMKR